MRHNPVSAHPCVTGGGFPAARALLCLYEILDTVARDDNHGSMLLAHWQADIVRRARRRWADRLAERIVLGHDMTI